MSDRELEKLRFPIGRYNPGDDIGIDDVTAWIEDIKNLPQQLIEVIDNVSDADLAKQYRPGSWTVRQVIHHMADSHINAYSRMKRTLTEDCPTIFPYDEKAWAQMDDVSEISINASVGILKGLHKRLHKAISDLSIQELARQFRHTDFPEKRSMAYLIGMYAWHGKHHVEHIRLALGK